MGLNSPTAIVDNSLTGNDWGGGSLRQYFFLRGGKFVCMQDGKGLSWSPAFQAFVQTDVPNGATYWTREADVSSASFFNVSCADPLSQLVYSTCTKGYTGPSNTSTIDLYTFDPTTEAFTLLSTSPAIYHSSDSHIAVATSDGSVIVVWTDAATTDTAKVYAMRYKSGTWGAPVLLHTRSGFQAGGNPLGVIADGATVYIVGWSGTNEPESDINGYLWKLNADDSFEQYSVGSQVYPGLEDTPEFPRNWAWGKAGSGSRAKAGSAVAIHDGSIYFVAGVEAYASGGDYVCPAQKLYRASLSDLNTWTVDEVSLWNIFEYDGGLIGFSVDIPGKKVYRQDWVSGSTWSAPVEVFDYAANPPVDGYFTDQDDVLNTLKAPLLLNVVPVTDGETSGFGIIALFYNSADESSFMWQDLFYAFVQAEAPPPNPPTILCADPPSGTVGTPYEHQMTLTGDNPPFTVEIIAGALPDGLSINDAGLITGTPTVAGTFPFTVQVTDNLAQTDSVACSITIGAALDIDCDSPPSGTVGVAYSHQLLISGGTEPYSVVITAGALPDGLSMSTGGLITGTPTIAGTFPFTATVTDADGSTDSVACSITINLNYTCPWIDLWVWRQLHQFTSLSDDYKFPPGYDKALVRQLAVDLQVEYQGKADPKLMAQAKQAFDELAALNKSVDQGTEDPQ